MKLFSIIIILFNIINITKQEDLDCTGIATYEVNMNGHWNKKRHPLKYPNSAHFSPLVGGTHTSDYMGAVVDTIATDGVKIVAETGSPSKYSNELKNSNKVYDYGNSGDVNDGNKPQASFMIKANNAHSMASFMSMIAPSPDWLVMFNNIELCDRKTGKWMESYKKSSLAYDAGTDSGKFFNSGDVETDPRESISRIGCGQVFCRRRTKMKPIASINFKLVSSDDDDDGSDGGSGDGSDVKCNTFKKQSLCLENEICRWRKQKKKRGCVKRKNLN